MSLDVDINKMILDRIKRSSVDKRTKDFLEEILEYEQGIADQERAPHFQEEYFKLIEKYGLSKK